jgi:hypothetical protein
VTWHFCSRSESHWALSLSTFFDVSDVSFGIDIITASTPLIGPFTLFSRWRRHHVRGLILEPARAPSRFGPAVRPRSLDLPTLLVVVGGRTSSSSPSRFPILLHRQADLSRLSRVSPIEPQIRPDISPRRARLPSPVIAPDAPTSSGILGVFLGALHDAGDATPHEHAPRGGGAVE